MMPCKRYGVLGVQVVTRGGGPSAVVLVGDWRVMSYASAMIAT